MSYFDDLQVIAKKTKTNRIVRYFPESDLRAGHERLASMASENGIDVSTLLPGEFLVFANRKINKLKIYAPGNVIAYLKAPGNQRIDLNVIRLIPRFFNGTEFKYDAALKASFELKRVA